MTGQGQYQHFIPKFILRKYDAEYEEPDKAAYRADPEYNGDEKSADKAWENTKKGRQKKSSIKTVIFEEISKSNASAKQFEERRARKDQRKIEKERKRVLKMGETTSDTVPSAESFEFGHGEFKMSVTMRGEINSVEYCHEEIKISLETRNCNTICGLIDMYERKRESELSKDEQQTAEAEKVKIESEFSRMEKRMADIIKVLEKDIADDKESSRLSQFQLYQIHHFLFIMFYRGSNFFKHYNTTKEAYKGSDKASLLRYMEAKGFAEPLEVWHHNLRVFIGLPPSPDLEAWEAELRANAYPTDATYLVDHVKDYYLCFCRPREADDAFIMTQNAFSVYDGRYRAREKWAFYHFFAPISPKFLILLRRRSMFRHSGRTRSPDWCESYPAEESSWLYHLPVGDIPLQINGNFNFKYLHIPSKYVSRINSILLDNAADTKLIIYSTTTSLDRALQVLCEQKAEAVGSLFIGGPESRMKLSGDEVRRREGGQPMFDGPYDFNLLHLSTLLKALVWGGF